MTERNNIRRIGRGLRAEDATIPTVEPAPEPAEDESPEVLDDE